MEDISCKYAVPFLMKNEKLYSKSHMYEEFIFITDTGGSFLLFNVSKTFAAYLFCMQ
jgi:hypothetical protein